MYQLADKKIKSTSQYNIEALKDFMITSEGTWYKKSLEDMRQQLHEKAEQEPEKASYYAAKAAGIKEVINWIKTHTASKGK